jgi:hypothetical protein
MAPIDQTTRHPSRLAHLVAALCSEVWQNRKRTSLSDRVNAYLVAMV